MFTDYLKSKSLVNFKNKYANYKKRFKYSFPFLFDNSVQMKGEISNPLK